MPGDPLSEISWIDSAGLAKVTGQRAGERRLIGTSPFPVGTAVLPDVDFVADVNTVLNA